MSSLASDADYICRKYISVWTKYQNKISVRNSWINCNLNEFSIIGPRDVKNVW